MYIYINYVYILYKPIYLGYENDKCKTHSFMTIESSLIPGSLVKINK